MQNGIVLKDFGTRWQQAQVIVDGKVVVERHVPELVAHGGQMAFDLTHTVYKITDKRSNIVVRPKGSEKLSYIPGEHPFSHVGYHLHPLPITVVWKNGKNLEEVTLQKAQEAAKKGQIRQWAFTQEILNYAAGESPSVNWRRAKVEKVPGEWTEDLLPKVGESFFVASALAGAPFSVTRRTEGHSAGWFNRYCNAYVLLPSEEQVQEALK